jgi:transcriptional regulator GlxA family with amidase domain
MKARNYSRRRVRAAHVSILAYDGVDELDLVSVYAPLAKAAANQSPKFPIVPSLAGLSRRVQGSNGLTFETTADIRDLGSADAVVIPGGPGVHELHQNLELSTQLRAAVAAQTPVYAICSGLFLLARLGLIDSKQVAVHVQKQAALSQLGVKHVASGYVEDGCLRSIGGAAGQCYVKGLEMGYRILQEFCPEAIKVVAARLETWPSFETGYY